METSHTHHKVLIIDDEEDICFLLKNILRKKNLEVFQASTLKEGFSKLAELHPFLLFLDINLPDGSGIDALEEIKKNYPLLKIIMISAYTQRHNDAKEEGVELFINKPFNKESIFNALEKIIHLGERDGKRI